MSRKVLLSIGFAGALALAMAAPGARADDLDQASKLTFSHAVELPQHVVLPAGTYWFVRPDGIKTPDLIQVYNADRSRVVAMMLTIPVDRRDSTEHTQLKLGEQAKNQPLALMQWYYPDRLSGHEFLYSPRQAGELAESAHITVNAKTAPQG